MQLLALKVIYLLHVVYNGGKERAIKEFKHTTDPRSKWLFALYITHIYCCSSQVLKLITVFCKCQQSVV